MAIRSSINAWGIPRTEEPGGRKESDRTQRLNNSLQVSGAASLPSWPFGAYGLVGRGRAGS